MLAIIVVPSNDKNCFFILVTYFFLVIAAIDGPLPEIVAPNAPDLTKFPIIWGFEFKIADVAIPFKTVAFQ